MSGRSVFSKPLIHQPPGAHQPIRLAIIRALRSVIRALPGSLRNAPRLKAFGQRLETGELWRTDIMAWRVLRGRQMGMKIGNDCRLYSLNIASEAELVEIGDGVIVSGEVMFVTHDGAVFTALEKFPSVNGNYGRIRIGNRCFLGLRAIIMPGVELGDNCVVAAGAVVTDSFGPNSVIAGNPAKYICPTSIYLELKKHSPATVYDVEHPFPLKLPPEKLLAQMAKVALKSPRRRDVTTPVGPRPGAGAAS
ncbi:MAG TPA: acyltransferase [Gemmatimonadaceae bacterium]|nr:acyltransferase [Gemmatimonadaceae bacterium]